MDPTISVTVWETKTAREVAEFIRQALLLRAGEVLDDNIAQERANNIAQGLYGCAIVEGK